MAVKVNSSSGRATLRSGRSAGCASHAPEKREISYFFKIIIILLNFKINLKCDLSRGIEEDGVHIVAHAPRVLAVEEERRGSSDFAMSAGENLILEVWAAFLIFRRVSLSSFPFFMSILDYWSNFTFITYNIHNYCLILQSKHFFKFSLPTEPKTPSRKMHTLTFFPAASTKSAGKVKMISFLPSIFLFSFHSPIGSS